MSSQGRRKGLSTKPLSIGSYYRTVSQARANVKEAVATVVVALWLGVIKAEDVKRLFDLVGTGGRELSEEESERFLDVLRVILARIVP